MWRAFYSVAATINTVVWGIYFSFTRRYIGIELGGGLRVLLLITGLEWAYVFFAVVADRFSKSVGRRRGILLGSTGAIPLAVSVFIRDPVSLALVLSLTSLSWSITWPLVMTTVFAEAQKKLGKVYSLFTVGTGLGFSLGSFAMGLLYRAGGPSLVLAACSSLCLLSYIVFYSFYPRVGEVSEDVARKPKALWTHYLRCVLIAYALLVFCREAYYAVAPVKLDSEISKVFPEISGESQYIAFGILYGGLVSFLSIPSRLLAGFLVDRCGPRLLLATSFILYAASYWFFISSEGIASIAIWQLPLYPLVDTSVNVLLARSSTGDDRARTLGVGLAFSAVGGLGVLPLVAYPGIDPVLVGFLITTAALCGMILVNHELLAKRYRRDTTM